MVLRPHIFTNTSSKASDANVLSDNLPTVVIELAIRNGSTMPPSLFLIAMPAEIGFVSAGAR